MAVFGQLVQSMCRWKEQAQARGMGLREERSDSMIVSSYIVRILRIPQTITIISQCEMLRLKQLAPA